MAGNEDIITAKYHFDLGDFKKQLDDLSTQVKRLNSGGEALENTFNEVGQTTAQSMVESTDAVKSMNKQAKDAAEEIKKAFNPKSLDGLKNALKQTANELGKVSTTGKLFKALTAESDKLKASIQGIVNPVKEVIKEAPTLGSQYKAAMLDVQNGVEGAAERAGQLKDAMDDANEAAKNLASGSKFEQFGNTLGSVSGKLAALDFGGAAEQAQALQKVSSSITFKETIQGGKDLVNTFVDLGASLLTNPLFLTGGALALIGIELYKLITAEEEELKVLKKITATNQTRFDNEIAGLERSIALEKAKGNNTDELEKQKLNTAKAKIKDQIKLQEKLVNDEEKLLELKESIYTRSATAIVLKQNNIRFNGETEATKKLNELRQADLNAENDINSKREEVIKAANDKAIEDQEKATDESKEFAKNRLDFQRTLEQERINLIQNSVTKELAENQFKYKRLIEDTIANENLLQSEKSALIAVYRDEQSKNEIDIRKKQSKVESDFDQAELAKREEESKALREKQTESQIEIDEADIERQTKLREDKLKAEQELSQKLIDINAATANAIADGFVGLYSAISTNEDGIFIVQKAAAVAKLIIDQQKAMAAYSIAQAEATVLAANPITAAAGTTALALITAQKNFSRIQFGIGLATVAAQTIRKFQPTAAFAEGTPYVEGGVAGKDSVSAILMPGERVVKTKDNITYWDDLEAMRKGKYSDHVNMNYVVPALQNAYEDMRHSQGMSMAENIANSILLNSQQFKDTGIIKSLLSMNESEGKRHSELVKAVKSSKRINYRKL